ncbi:MAG: TonB-dependent receptor plug domain-containing protein [Bacteroidota bacterium]|nr:TonB-dependent receptor plug domain-containing protein [Bacteroidota bacterium]
MKTISPFLLPFFIWLFHTSNLTDPGDKILIGLKQWHDNNPQEKIFVQTDKDKYLAGESIWLKAWCTIENKPSFLSKILYIEIADTNGNVVDKKMYPLDNLSSSNGVIDLKSDIKTGNYFLNAYTLWMLNYPQFVFKKNIFIYNSDYTSKSQSVKNNNQLIFFPEGGEMIEQLNGRVAFKATNESGYPVFVKGSVFTNSGTKVIDFQSQHDGMGSFEIQPAANTTYKAKVVFNNGITAEYILPSAKIEGASLQIQNSVSRVFLIANRSEVNKNKYNKLIVVAQINGNPVYKANFNFDEGESAASIIKKNLPAGIMQITLFDSAENPLSERLVFIDNYKLVEPSVSLEKLNVGKRAHNSYSFTLDSVEEPNISVLVVNNAIDPFLYTKENIASSFLLSSDIKGYIHNPGYYFSNKGNATLQHLDLLLMTQGWRRFTWRQIKGEENIALKYPVETYLNIRGKVTKSDRPEPVTNGLVTFMIKGEDSSSILSNAYLTDKGEFIVDSLFFKSKAQVSYQGTNNQKSQLPVDVKIYPAYIDTLKKSGLKLELQPDTTNSTVDRNSLPEYMQTGLRKLDTSGVKVLQNIVIKGKKINRVDSLQKEYVSTAYEQSDQTLVIPEGRNFTNIWQFLNMNVPGLNVNPFEPGGVSNVTFGRYIGLNAIGDSEEQYVKFFLNEIPVATDVINTVNPEDVALIKIYKGATGFAFGADAGAISIYTKKGANVAYAIFDKRFLRTDKIGYAVTREFYHPNYTLYPQLNKNQKDERVVLFWNPQLKPNKENKYLIDFHNSDNANSFKLIIQGLDSKGHMIYKEEIIK